MNAFENLVALVVEDSAVQRAQAMAVVKEMGFGTVLEAENGLDALRILEQAEQRQVFLLVTDIDMPEMDGIELIGKLAEAYPVDNLIVTSARDPRLLETVERIASDHSSINLLGTIPKPLTTPALAKLLNLAKRTPPPGQAAPSVYGMMTLDEIEAAIDDGHVVPYFQPKVDVKTGAIRGVEALARIALPDQGLVPPQRFITTLEGSPLMQRFTLAMVGKSLERFKTWTSVMPHLKISLNLSADDLAEKTFLDQLMARVQSHGVDPSLINWEVTETMVMKSQSLANLARLGLKGYGLSMDDYGIGYSSNMILAQSPFTELKIDRIFVHGASTRLNRRAVLENAIDMARTLQITTVAEGVEDVADWSILYLLGCDQLQGYLVSRPMPGEDFLPWVKSSRIFLRETAHAAAAGFEPSSPN
ncbi:MAG: EAL domain-containing response regulator [Burkholderiaceae bacterium]|nr:EAL domain-containing response regulator [Roseateles sp.]MBV8471440.1 EAL domain-containing response regulator [Burkholderiaceae bacterium]